MVARQEIFEQSRQLIEKSTTLRKVVGICGIAALGAVALRRWEAALMIAGIGGGIALINEINEINEVGEKIEVIKKKANPG